MEPERLRQERAGGVRIQRISKARAAVTHPQTPDTTPSPGWLAVQPEQIGATRADVRKRGARGTGAAGGTARSASRSGGSRPAVGRGPGRVASAERARAKRAVAELNPLHHTLTTLIPSDRS